MDKVAEILFSNAQNGVCFVAPNGQFLRVNKRLCEMLGYSEAELLKIDFQGITHPDDLPPDMVQVGRVLSGEINEYSMNKRYLHGVKRSWWWAKLDVGCIRGDDGNVAYFISQIQEIATRKLTSEQWGQVADFKAGLDRGEVVLHWQPIVELATYKAIGYEGLARWQHPKKGVLYPGSFIPLLEATQNLHLLCHQVFKVMATAKLPSGTWKSVNVANTTMSRDDWPVQSRCLTGSGIHVEILETALVTADVDRLIRQLRARGVAIAIDDYGTGHSTESLLANDDGPFDILKVDKSIIQKLGRSDRAHEICQGIIHFARRFNLETVAEGVETQEQATIARQVGFDAAQGFLFGRPAPLGGSSSA